jgi:hypothetical protein
MRIPFSSLRPTLGIILALAAPFALGACGQTKDSKAAVDALDEKLVGKGSDPVMNTAIDDRILVDPAMTDSANVTVVKTADQPLNGAIPPDNGYEGDIASSEELNSAKMLRAPKPTVITAENCTNCGDNRAVTLGSLAEDQGVKRGKGTCDAKLQYGAGWSTRMPYEFPVYPRGRVKEAGGVENGLCDIRAVSFSTSAAMSDVVDYYYSRAKHTGYSADYEVRAGEHMLGGVRDKDGGAYVITFNAHPGGGTAVDIVANNGR